MLVLLLIAVIRCHGLRTRLWIALEERVVVCLRPGADQLWMQSHLWAHRLIDWTTRDERVSRSLRSTSHTLHLDGRANKFRLSSLRWMHRVYVADCLAMLLAVVWSSHYLMLLFQLIFLHIFEKGLLALHYLRLNISFSAIAADLVLKVRECCHDMVTALVPMRDSLLSHQNWTTLFLLI